MAQGQSRGLRSVKSRVKKLGQMTGLLSQNTVSPAPIPDQPAQPAANTVFKSHYGHCECCKSHTLFEARHTWLRDNYLCTICGCIPRERALMYVINRTIGDFSGLHIHESSPGGRGASIRLRDDCHHYVSSHYWEDETYTEGGHLNVDLQNQKLDSDIFDLVVTQDVFEHLPDPVSAAKEIYRTLKPGGYLIQTVPLMNGFEKTVQWATLENGAIKWFFEEEYHGNPIDASGSPVFWHYGYDLAKTIDAASGFETVIFANTLPDFGIEGLYNEVMVSRKPA